VAERPRSPKDVRAWSSSALHVRRFRSSASQGFLMSCDSADNTLMVLRLRVISRRQFRRGSCREARVMGWFACDPVSERVRAPRSNGFLR
jgi:hypothetical protein